jgi:hypothetical protein
VILYVNDLVIVLFIVGKYGHEYAQGKHTIKRFKYV